MMKAWTLNDHGMLISPPLELRELPAPKPGRGELRLQVRTCGICRTDLHIIAGEVPVSHFPTILGHQVVGVVDARGPGCKRFELGDRVGIAWLRHTCGKCAFCARGEENLCPEQRHTGCHDAGGFATCAIVPDEFAYAIPDSFDDAHAAPLLCAGIIGYRALRRSRAQEGETLGLFGFGSSAHITLQVARDLGVEVEVITRTPEHATLARKLGAGWAGPIAEREGDPLDRAIVFAPAGEVVPQALAAVRPGGTVACAGIHMSEIPPLDYSRHLFQERELTSVTANTRADGEDLLRIAGRISVHTEVEVFPFAELPDGLRALDEGRVRGSAVLAVDA